MKFLLILLSCFSCVSWAAPSHPNFVVILTDNIGKDWFAGYGGDGGHTPNVDRLAAGGISFRHCYVTPLCSTTRVEFLTGRYGFSTGWHTHHDAAFYGGGGLLSTHERTWAGVLRDAGYATCITGKWQIDDLYEHHDALKHAGFDEHFVWSGALEGEGFAEQRWKASIAPGGKRGIESRYWDPVIFKNGEHAVLNGKFGPDEYLDYLLGFIERNKDKPFVAYYACPFSHIPTVPTPLTPDPKAPERDQFIGMLRSMDAQVGRVVAALDRLALRDNTFIVFTSDNGTPGRLSNTMRGQRVKGGLGTMSENGLDVPLIVNCPARVPAGRLSDVLTDCSDIFPTLLELAGVPTPAGLKIDGHSFAPEALGQRGDWKPREFIFAQYGAERAVRDQRFKLYNDGRLFDVENDVEEQKNLASSDDAAVTGARQKLQKALVALPKDADVGFPFRSASAFKKQGEEGKEKK